MVNLPILKALHVLVVDDSAVVRTMMTAVLCREPGVTVDTAADPLIAMEKIKRRRPNVILLDLEMPHMDGLSFMRKLNDGMPIPVVVCSGLAGPGTDTALRAMDEGALAIVSKPKLGVRDFLADSADEIIGTVRAAAQAKVHRQASPASRPRLNADVIVPEIWGAPLAVTTDKVIAIGASTGGTEALRIILEALPPGSPGIVAVQHMPEGFTAAFAARLNSTCRIEVKEAADGDRILAGRALVAPGNKHTLVERSGAHYTVRVVGGPLVSRHRPSVDVLFRSVAKAAGMNAVGVILTGMGDDGAVGLLEMRQMGAVTLAQDEATCIVFGMPKEAIEKGGVQSVVPLHNLAGAMLRAANF